MADRDSAAILRFLEENPQDEAARAALADALVDEGRDEPLAFAVWWLRGKGYWVRQVASGGPDDRYEIDLSDLGGPDRRPFSAPTRGATVGACLRSFAGYLWAFKAETEDLLSNQPTPKRPVRRVTRTPVTPSGVDWVPTRVPRPVDPWYPPFERSVEPDWTYRRERDRAVWTTTDNTRDDGYETWSALWTACPRVNDKTVN